MLKKYCFKFLEQLCLAKIVRTSPYYGCKKPILFQYEFYYNRDVRPRLLSNCFERSTSRVFSVERELILI